MSQIVEFDLKNERVVLATMARDASQRRRLSLALSPGEFGDPKHRVLFRALAQMAKASLEWSEDTIADLAGDEDFGGFEFVRALVRDYEPNVNVDHHVERLRLDAAKFLLVGEDVPSLVERCRDPKSTPDQLARILRGGLARVERTGRRFVARGGELRDAYWEEMRLRGVVGDVLEGTGFPVLDQGLTRGLVPGLSCVVGRPGHGKSTWLANLLRRRVAAGKATYVCGWEMGRVDYVDMMVAAETGIPAEDLARRVRAFSQREKEQIVDAVERFARGELLAIEHNPFPHLPPAEKRWDVNSRNLDHLEAVVRQEADRYPLFAVDVIGKLLADRRPEAIGEALVRIRELAISCGVHVMLLHHLNRDAAQGRPSLEGIKGSGSFEEEADLIFGIDRPILRASPARRRKMHDVLDVHVLKQRKGPAPFVTRHRFDGSRFLLSGEVEVDVSMLEDDEPEGMA